MKTLKYYLLAICITTVFAGNSQTEESKVEPPIFGLGLNLTQFRFSDLFSDWFGAPANQLMITVSPMKSLRLEPEFGILSFKHEETDGNNQTHDLKDKVISFGIGAFGMIQRGQTNIYGGLRYNNAQMTSEYLDLTGYDVNFNPIYSVVKDEGTRSTVAPTIGAEYFFGQHFSIGGEFSLRIMKVNSRPSGSSTTQVENDIVTGAGLQMRFYL